MLSPGLHRAKFPFHIMPSHIGQTPGEVIESKAWVGVVQVANHGGDATVDENVSHGLKIVQPQNFRVLDGMLDKQVGQCPVYGAERHMLFHQGRFSGATQVQFIVFFQEFSGLGNQFLHCIAQ